MSMEMERKQSQPEPGAAAGAPSSAPGNGAVLSIPADALIIVPVRNMVLFPGMILPLSIGRESSIAAAQQAVRGERPIGLLLQRDRSHENPGPDDVHRAGTVAQVLRYVTTPDGGHHLICQGQERFVVQEFLPGYPFLVARVERITDGGQATQGIEARFIQLKRRAAEALELLPQTPPELASAVQGITSPGALADMVAGFMDINPAEKQQILETFNVEQRLDRVLELLASRIEVLKISKEIDDRTKASVDQRQREFMLREQMKTIQKELGEGEEGSGAEIAELEKALADAGMPEEVEAHVRKELKRLSRMSEQSAEYSMARTYVDWLIELPWKIEAEEKIDLAEARRILDEDHFGLDKIKKRILEFLAVRKLNPGGHSPILCFVGPPGVGKTSLGQSIAKALARKFVRVALGGVHDEAEIRGHRRTYVGALPGNIIQAIKKAGSRDCVMMLDEIDKLGQGFHGDPSSALLEVLDPEQNSTFRDAYLGVPFDLSRVTFITTANVLDTIPGPLRDRMEVIQLPGYTEEEKLQIAKKYLVKRQLERNGLAAEKLEITDAALRSVIHDYTREAGVRNLEREIGSIVRSAAVKIAEGSLDRVRVDQAELQDILGPSRFEGEVAQRTSVPGVATGLAWTPVGGDILFIEASRTPGNGRLILTGQLGDVMKESAQAALTLVKSRSEGMGVDAAALEKSDIHVHVPAGAIPKDGPSAGVAMFMALASLLTNRVVRNDTAMTGEISLRGLVLPVGGIKEKVLAAMRAGLTTVMLPNRNQKDLQDVPEEARRKLEFVFLETVDDALKAALVGRPEREPLLAD
ncbi:MAG TPA: endopeptidase La [Burkholderiales bacterium]|nr:endopeptidase La [Burkholderiales bacterium]